MNRRRNPEILLPEPPLPPSSECFVQSHGYMVPDPFRPLEETTSQSVKHWIDLQNARTDRYLEQVPERNEIFDYLKDIWDSSQDGVPKRRGGRIFFTRRQGVNTPVHVFYQDELSDEPRLLIDLEKEGGYDNQAMVDFHPCPKGRFVAHVLSKGGSDSQLIRVVDVDSGRLIPETLNWCKFAQIAWLLDGQSFIYNGCSNPSEVPGQEWDWLSYN